MNPTSFHRIIPVMIWKTVIILICRTRTFSLPKGLCCTLLGLYFSFPFQSGPNPSMDNSKRTSCTSVSYTPTSWLPVQRLGQVFSLPGWFIVFLPSLSRSIYPPNKAGPNPCFFLLLLDHDFLMDHFVALEIVPISDHSFSCFRSLAQRNGHFILEGLLPRRQINLCRAQVSHEACKCLELTRVKRRGMPRLWNLFPFSEEWPQPSATCLLSPCQCVKGQAEISMLSPSREDALLILSGGVA